jgi:hypothetical protein
VPLSDTATPEGRRRVIDHDEARREADAPHAYLAAEPQPTSVAAADDMRLRSGTIRSEVLGAIVARPSTDDELLEALALNPNSVRPRRVELADWLMVEPSGITRPTRWGRDAIVWQATDLGRQALAALDAREVYL